MNNFKLLLPVLILLAGCAREEQFEYQVDNGSIPISVEGKIDQISTKATADGFVDGDALGLFAVNYTNGNTVPGTLEDSGNQADNAKYVFDEKAWKWNSLKPVYYKDVNTNVDLYVYYPYQSSIGSVSAYNFEVQKDQSKAATQIALSGYEASDFLWGKVENVTPTESKIQVTLNHKLASVIVVLEEGSGFSDGEFAILEKSVLVTGTTRKATINFANAAITPVGGAQIDGIVMAKQEDGAFRAIVIPQSLDAGISLFSITVNGQSYGFKMDKGTEYASGKMNRFTIKINRKTPSGEYELELAQTEILPWTEDRNTHGGEARQYYVVNVETPGTLGRTIKADKKNPDKIRNLKVTGTVTTEDFYFMRDSMAILEAVNMKESKIKDALLTELRERNGYAFGGLATERTIVDYPKVIIDNAIPSDAFLDKASLYFFVFPESVTAIGSSAFKNSSLSGPLTLPSDLKVIRPRAFGKTNITRIIFNDKLEEIGECSFALCASLSGELRLPMSLRFIYPEAFESCNFSGPLTLPPLLEVIGGGAFFECGSFTGDLSLPDKITHLDGATFYGSGFSGSLHLNNLQKIGMNDFALCGFSGALILNPETTEIPSNAFQENYFTELQLPKNVKQIGYGAFGRNSFLNPLVIPDGCVVIGMWAFKECPFIPEITLPSSLMTIQDGAFSQCFGVTKMTSYAVEPPLVFGGAFDGIGKDNLTLEVPPESVTRYSTTEGWSDFKRIAAHYDFSINRRLYRALNASVSRQFAVRAPANMNWSIESKPDWVTVSPDHGTGNTNVVIMVNELPRTSETFESEIWKNGAYQESKTYKGRSGDVVFLLDEKDYRSTMSVEQYDYEYADGQALQPLYHTQGSGIDLVFLGDGYDARDIAEGTYLQNMQEAIEHFFAIEPYATYKDYFNAHIVFARSEESGIETANTINENKFGSYLPRRLAIQRPDDVFSYAKMAPIGEVSKTLAILMVNTSIYEGITYMYGDGSAIAVCPVSTDAYPYDFRGIVQHEAGGHGFGKLGDEYIYCNAYADACPKCGDVTQAVLINKGRGWYRNMELTGDWNQVGWSHLIFHPSYSDFVDVYEGGYMHSRHIWRSEANSCMNNNIPYYSTISRQAIVERIKEYAGESFTLEDFYANDKTTVGPTTKGAVSIGDFNAPDFRGYSHEHGPVFMGEHPNIK